VHFFFFFQAEDGIRDFHVTGVQTCALPILPVVVSAKAGTMTSVSSPGASRRQGGGGSKKPQGLGMSCVVSLHSRNPESPRVMNEIGRASCRERGEMAVDAGAVEKQREDTEQ